MCWLLLKMIKGFVLCTLLLLLQNISEGDGQERESFSRALEFKSGYNPYRIFGDVPMPPKKSAFRSKLFSSCLCIDVGSVDAIFVRIKVASSLRYNLIKVFGYILHRKQIELNTDYYTSLYFILTVIKLNHVDIISLVEVLVKIQFEKPNSQYTLLFEAMEKHLPKYLICAATFWKEGIRNKTIDMDKIVMPYNDDTVVVNILDGITPQEVQRVTQPDPPEKPENEIEKKILFDFNPNILKLYQTLKKRASVNVFAWVVAGLLHFFPRTLIQPDLEESILILTQYFYQHKIPEFQNIDVTKENRGPFEMVKLYLAIIIKSKNAYSTIQDSALTVYKNLKNRCPTAVNPHYTSFTYFVQPDNIKVLEMLKYVSKGAFPLEIILAARRISFYIDQKIIGYFSYMSTFNPYLYSTPNEVLIAILDRIMRRQTELSAEVLDSVGAVYSYLIFKYRYTAMPVSYPTDMSRINVLIMGLKAPDISISIRRNVDTLISLLIQEHVQYSEILIKKVPIYKCGTPVICFMELLIVIKDMQILGDPKIWELIKIIVTPNRTLEIEEMGRPDDLYPNEMRIKDLNDNDCKYKQNEEQTLTTTTAPVLTTNSPEPTTTAATTTTTKTTPKTTTKPPPTTPTEGPIKTASTAPPTSPTTPTAPPPIQTTDITVLPELAQDANRSMILMILRNLSLTAETQEAEYARKMLIIMEQANFKQLMEKCEKDHVTIIGSYLAILQVAKKEYSEAGFTKYLTKMVAKYKRIEAVLTNMVIEPNFAEPALYTLSIALPAPTEAEKAKFDLIKVVLSRQELFMIIKDHIKNKELTNVGTLLKAVLKEEAKLTNKLSKEEVEAVKYYETKVQEHGFAESKIMYSFHQEVIKREVHISKIMDNAIDYNKLSNAEKTQFNSIIEHLKHNNILEQWTKWHLYSTCGEFTQAMFKYLLSTPSITANIREAVQKITPKINLDNDGKKPSFSV